jgi:integrase
MSPLRRLRYVQSFQNKKTGGVFHYFRRTGCPRVKLPGLPGSAEFMAAYQAALAAPPHEIGATRTLPGSLDAALANYYQSHAFRALKGGTPAMHRAILERWRNKDGTKPIGMLPTVYIERMLSTMPPHAARNTLKAIRRLMQFCVKQELCRSDPTAGIRATVPKSDGYYCWSEDDIARFEAFHPIGSKARLALALPLYTAQRRSDIIRMGRQHVRDGLLSVKQQKTGKPLAIPIHPQLRAILDATPSSHLTFLTTKTGKPYAPSDFSEQFRAWCDAAGLPPECSVHGLRMAACRRLAEAGCTPHHIMSISGHKTLALVAHYTDAVDQASLAREAMARIGNETVKPDPAELSNALKLIEKKPQGRPRQVRWV